jgi:hypothetical protein
MLNIGDIHLHGPANKIAAAEAAAAELAKQTGKILQLTVNN